MKETYSRPTITNAGTIGGSDDLFPVVQAAAEAATTGYGLGKTVRKVFGAEFSPSGEAGLVQRKKFTD